MPEIHFVVLGRMLSHRSTPGCFRTLVYWANSLGNVESRSTLPYWGVCFSSKKLIMTMSPHVIWKKNVCIDLIEKQIDSFIRFLNKISLLFCVVIYSKGTRRTAEKFWKCAINLFSKNKWSWLIGQHHLQFWKKRWKIAFVSRFFLLDLKNCSY